MNYKIHYSCICHVGKCRNMNQDNYICNGSYMDRSGKPIQYPLSGDVDISRFPIIGVFDGLGGEEHGEIASLIAAKTASKFPIESNPVLSLRKYCSVTNDSICKYADQHGMMAMGTTAAMLAFTNSGITLCNIGDSKIFRFAEGELEQISVDHYAIAAHGMKPPLSQNLGIPPTELRIDPYLAQGEYTDEDVYLLCSDGLTDMVKTAQIQKILQETDFDRAAEILLNEALKNGGEDNITIILCEISRVRKGLANLFNF